jgi:hypothetical protein
MEITSLSYERMVEDALRGVLRQALEITQAQGLPGAHHFYITFDTTHPGVDIAASLHALHPSEMTIVMQHQFWDLKVLDEHFEITLSFSGVSQRLVVPFAAVTAFADPHAKFGLQFHVEFEEQTDNEDEDEDDDAGDPPLDDALPIDSANVTQRLKTARLAPAASNTKTAAVVDDTPGKVVTLDAFRKK